MLIIPAIDIRNGRCVMLTQGNFNRTKVYEIGIEEAAGRWETQGATLLHIVDLDGAESDKLVNIKAIKAVLKKVKIPLQVGGGIRDEQMVDRLFNLGVARVILGTAVYENDVLLRVLLKKYGAGIVVSLDVKNKQLMKRGWQEKSNKNLMETTRYLQNMEISDIILTDIKKDGMLSGPDFSVIKNFRSILGTSFIVSGGVSSLDDIKKLKTIGVAGVIIGKALYEKRFTLKEAIAC